MYSTADIEKQFYEVTFSRRYLSETHKLLERNGYYKTLDEFDAELSKVTGDNKELIEKIDMINTRLIVDRELIGFIMGFKHAMKLNTIQLVKGAV